MVLERVAPVVCLVVSYLALFVEQIHEVVEGSSFRRVISS